ncbi:MAG: nucleotide exchange factor GrpE [Acidobacteria bacterium]|nr:nucleotide exchange factor GrpE [Acidobacteriota bacterium]
MTKKDDRKTGGAGGTRIPIRFFSRKPAGDREPNPEEASSIQEEPLAAQGKDALAERTTSELEPVMDEAHEQLARSDDPEAMDTANRTSSLEKERAALQEQLLRVAAEFDNYRKRVERDRNAEIDRSRGRIIEAFLPIVDNLHRALAMAKSDGHASSLVSGIELIGRQFDEVLASFDVRPIPTAGAIFDPAMHEAIATAPAEDLPENTILEEYQRGYMSGDQLLRPARVKVATR